MIVLVTGASTGIGCATAEALAHRGWTVLGGHRAAADGEALAAAGITPLRLDVTSEQDVAALRGRSLDALVNNAGIAVTGPLEFLPLDELRRQLEVNAVAQLAVTQACLPALRNSSGRIVNISSIGGRLTLPLYGPYAASKYALEAISDALRRELRGAVHVSVIEPGATATPIWGRGVTTAEELMERMPPEAHERYGALAEALKGEAQKNAEHGDPPQVVVDAIVHALTAPRPRARYVTGRRTKVQATLARVLPDRTLDALLARLLHN